MCAGVLLCVSRTRNDGVPLYCPVGPMMMVTGGGGAPAQFPGAPAQFPGAPAQYPGAPAQFSGPSAQPPTVSPAAKPR